MIIGWKEKGTEINTPSASTLLRLRDPTEWPCWHQQPLLQPEIQQPSVRTKNQEQTQSNNLYTSQMTTTPSSIKPTRTNLQPPPHPSLPSHDFPLNQTTPSRNHFQNQRTSQPSNSKPTKKKSIKLDQATKLYKFEPTNNSRSSESREQTNNRRANPYIAKGKE